MRNSWVYARVVGVAGAGILASLSLAQQPARAADDVWTGSYAAEGSCFCSGQLGTRVQRSIVPTPVGGQTVAQVCKRVGPGPALTKTGDAFNFPVYADPQCGNGPFIGMQVPADDDCTGSLSPDLGDCQATGPRWDLKSAYGKGVPAAKQAVVTKPAMSVADSSKPMDAELTDADAPMAAAAGVVGADSDVSQRDASGNPAHQASAHADVSTQNSMASSELSDADDPAALMAAKPGIASPAPRYIDPKTGKAVSALSTAADPAPGVVTGGSRYIKPPVRSTADVASDVGRSSATSESASTSTSTALDSSSNARQRAATEQRDPATGSSLARAGGSTSGTADTTPESPESLRQRQAVLLEAARERLKAREAARAQESAVQQDSLAELAAEEERARQAQVVAEAQRAERAAEEERLRQAELAAEEARVLQAERAAEEERLRQAELAAEEERVLQAERAAEDARLSQAEMAADEESLRQAEIAAEDERVRQAELEIAEAEAREAELAAEQALADEQQQSVAEAADAISSSDGGDVNGSVLSALRLPAATRASSKEFGYVDALPISFDFGGNGMQVAGSSSSHQRMHYVARAGVANTYQEVMLGAGYHFTPPKADRMTLLLTAGVEYGSFQLEAQGVEADLTDTGLFLSFSSRFVVNNRFELQGGVNYSSFFEGDPGVFGAGFYHLNRQIDLMSRFELGDNDSIGIGLRYYY